MQCRYIPRYLGTYIRIPAQARAAILGKPACVPINQIKRNYEDTHRNASFSSTMLAVSVSRIAHCPPAEAHARTRLWLQHTLTRYTGICSESHDNTKSTSRQGGWMPCRPHSTFPYPITSLCCKTFFFGCRSCSLPLLSIISIISHAVTHERGFSWSHCEVGDAHDQSTLHDRRRSMQNISLPPRGGRCSGQIILLAKVHGLPRVPGFPE